MTRCDESLTGGPHASAATTPAASGGKAARLAALRAAGFPVPPFELVDNDEELEQQVARLGFPLVVRSSATAEDGQRASFAGQLASFLNLRSLEAVRQAVNDCRASLHTDALQGYCRRQGIDPTSLRMHPILQRMIEPQVAGVAFSLHPTTGADEVVVEACVGLADDLLAGRQPPLPLDDPRLAPHLPAIRALVRQVQRHYGTPQDIEFAIDGQGIHLLQARPITRCEFISDSSEWTNANFREGGVSSSVCSPLMWSLYEMIWSDSIKQSLREIRLFRDDFVAGQLFFGRPYWNVGAVKDAVAQLPGFREREFDGDLHIGPTYDGLGRTTPWNFGTLCGALPTLAALPGFFRRRQQEAERLLAELPQLEASWEQRSLGHPQVWEQTIAQDYRRVEGTYFRTIYALSLAKLDWKHWFPASDFAALVAALPPLKHLAPVRRLRAMRAAAAVDVPALQSEFRHHCRWGIDIRHPRWEEDEEFVTRWATASPTTPAVDPRPAWEQTCADERRALPWWRRAQWERKLRRLRHLVWLREELRDISNRLYYWLRRHALALGERHGLGTDVFFQTYWEVTADDRHHLEERRDTFLRFRHFTPPHEIRPRRSSSPTPEPGELRGLGASRGCVSGPTFVAESVEQALHAPAGSILVCPFTEPGWTPVLDRVAGVITETGGQLSHAAVICREYGLPAVLAVPHVMRRLRTGMRVAIDGSRGTIQLLADRPAASG